MVMFVLYSQVTRVTKVDLNKDAQTASDDTDPVMRNKRHLSGPGVARAVVSETGSNERKKVRRSSEVKDTDDLLCLLQDDQEPGIFERTGSSRRRRRRPANLDSLVTDRERGASPNRFSSGTNSPPDSVAGDRRSYSSIDRADVDRVLGTDRWSSIRGQRSPLVTAEASTPSLLPGTVEATTAAAAETETHRLRDMRREERKRRSRFNLDDVRAAFTGSNSTETIPDEMSERRKRWAERRSRSVIEPSAVMRILEHGKVAQPTTQTTPQANDVEQMIRDVEKTGREIQSMRLDIKGNSRRPASSDVTRRWRSHLDKEEVKEATRNSQNDADDNHARSRSSSETSSQNQLEDLPETPSQKAMLNHSTGSWRSNSTDDEVQLFQNPTSTGYIPVRTGLTQTRRRPYSTYDNIPENGPSLSTPQYVRSNSSDVTDDLPEIGSSRDSRRHAKVYDDTVNIDDPSPSSLHRSSTLPHHWRANNRWAHPIIEDDKAGKHRLQQQRQIKMDALKTADGNIIAAPAHRDGNDLQQLDSNIQAFQSRTLNSDRELGRKNRFREMALARRNYEMDDTWDDVKSVDADRASSVVSTTELVDSLCKSDSDSVASARDEGFESECVSNSQRTSMSSTLDGELQSMGGNVDSDGMSINNTTGDDLMSSPRDTRKDYIGNQTDPDDAEESKNYFARSIDSLVNTKDLTLTDTINVDEPEDNYYQSTNEDTDRTITASDSAPRTPDEDDSAPDETWTTETYTVEHKMSVPETEPLPPAPPHRTTSKAESAKAATPTRVAQLRKPDKGATKTLRKSLSPTKTPTTAKTTTRSKTNSSPLKSLSVADAVTARLSRPKRPNGLTRHPSTSSLTSDGSSAGSTVTTKSTLHSRPTRPSSVIVSQPSRATTRSSLTPEVTPTRSFVRGAAGRATMPASMLRTQKRLAAEARLNKEVAPVPPRRSSSIRRSRQLNLGVSPPLNRLSPASPGDAESATSSGDERVTTTTGRPRRAALSSSSFASRDKDGKVSRFFNRLATSEKPPSPSSDGLRRRTMPPRQRTTSTIGDDDSKTDENRNEKATTDKSFFKKIIDKSPYRKSVLNRSACGDMSPACERKGRVDISKTTLRSSKCWVDRAINTNGSSVWRRMTEILMLCHNKLLSLCGW